MSDDDKKKARTSTVDDEEERGDALNTTMKAILDPARLARLQAFDTNVVNYETYSFWIIFRCTGRNFGMILLPLVFFTLLDVSWYIVLETLLDVDYAKDGLSDDKQDLVEQLDKVISPILIPVSFLLVFRLGRGKSQYCCCEKEIVAANLHLTFFPSSRRSILGRPCRFGEIGRNLPNSHLYCCCSNS